MPPRFTLARPKVPVLLIFLIAAMGCVLLPPAPVIPRIPTTVGASPAWTSQTAAPSATAFKPRWTFTPTTTFLPSLTPTPSAIPSATATIPPSETSTSTPVPQPTRIFTRPTRPDIVYCSPDGLDLALDLYEPASGQPPYPLVIFIHGGSWISGRKDAAMPMNEIPLLLEAGFVVASLDYRLSPEYKFPAHVVDVKCAVRFLRASAEQFRIDPGRVALWGASAGGHLAALAALTSPADGWDVGENTDQSSQVQAVVDMYGPADLTDPALLDHSSRFLKDLFGMSDPTDPIVAIASPITHVSASAPPFLIIQGELDTIVPPEQSQRLFGQLKLAGVNPQLLMVANAAHGFSPVDVPATQPTRAEIAVAVVNFLSVILK